MTGENGHTVAGDRAEEVADYVEQVREALSDLPLSERDELVEDLRTHLTEVAAEGPAPLSSRLGPPEDYAAELRAAAAPAADQPRQTIAAWARGHADRLAGRLRRLDVRVGPLLGYRRATEFTRLLVPAWWVLRGYLAAMLVVTWLDRSGPIGLLPRLGGSTLVGLIILAGFVAGSIWLAHREPGLGLWPRRAVFAGTAVVVLFGAVGLASLDNYRPATGAPPQVYTDHQVPQDRYEDVQDVYVLDAQGQLVTDVHLVDQDGNLIDIGWDWCREYEYDAQGRLMITYPRCPEELPWWANQPGATPSPGPSGAPTPTPSATLTPTPAVTPTATPAPSLTPSPSGR